MLREIVTIAVPLLAPTVLYMIWVSHRARRARSRGEEFEARRLAQWPWLWLVLSGAVFAAATLALAAMIGVGDIHREYVPPHLDESGKVVPGHYIDK